MARAETWGGGLSTAGPGEGDSHCPRETTVVEEDASLSIPVGIQTKAAVGQAGGLFMAQLGVSRAEAVPREQAVETWAWEPCTV